MPPPDSSFEIWILLNQETIKKMVEQGGQVVEKHWLYPALKKRSLPKTESAIGPNEIDAFILEKLEECRVMVLLIERRSITLIVGWVWSTGLPPQCEEVRTLSLPEFPRRIYWTGELDELFGFPTMVADNQVWLECGQICGFPVAMQER